MAPLPCKTFDPERLANHISSLSNCTLTKRQRLYKSCHENAQILLITQRELQAHRDVRYMHRLAKGQDVVNILLMPASAAELSVPESMLNE